MDNMLQMTPEEHTAVIVAVVWALIVLYVIVNVMTSNSKEQ